MVNFKNYDTTDWTAYTYIDLFLRNHTQNVVESLVPGLFIKNQN